MGVESVTKEYHLIFEPTGQRLNGGLAIIDIDVAYALKRQIEARQSGRVIVRQIQVTDLA